MPSLHERQRTKSRAEANLALGAAILLSSVLS